MTLQPGTILISSPNLADSNFEKAVICICEYNNKGAMGFVINHPFARNLNELVEFRNCKSFPLNEGGPVKNDSLYFMHSRADKIEGGLLIADGTYLGGDFKQAVSYINDAVHPEENIKLFIGYCGWDPDQLEEEITEGSWLIADVAMSIVFKNNMGQIWDTLFARL